jgi:iron complex outermembrane receptor protein
MNQWNKRYRYLVFIGVVVGMGLSSAAWSRQDANPSDEDRSDETIETVRVFGQRNSLTQPTASEDADQLARVPGGTNLIDLTRPMGRNRTLEDLFARQPGIVVQEFFGGNDQPRINIRGSGIQSNPQARGIRFLRDGLPLNLADGSYVIGAFSPRTAAHVTVHRGANALALGGTSLGGAINFVSPSGRDQAGHRLAFGGGSFGERSGEFSSRGQRGQSDASLTLSWSEQDGFRQRNEGQQGLFSANFGQRLSARVETRVYLDYSDVEFQIPGPLTRAQLNEDPRQINWGIQPPPPGPQTGTISVGPNVARDLPWRSADFQRLASRTTWLGDRSAWWLGVSFQRGDDQFGSPNLVRDSQSDDWAATLNWLADPRVGAGTLHAGIQVVHGDLRRRYFANERGRVGRQFADNAMSATDWIAFIEYERPLSDRLTLTLAGQGVHTSRDVDERFAEPELRPRYNAGPDQYTSFATAPVAFQRDYKAFNPRLGLLLDLTADVQGFANLSRSFEPPTFLELVQPTGGNPDQGPNDFGVAPLEAQRAWTAEVGIRQAQAAMNWELTAYWSRVRNELLTSEAFFGGVGVTSNYPDPTVHRGIEAGLDGRLADSLIGSGDELRLSASYEWSDFFFNGGQFDDKQIAGVPEHRLQAELRYRTAGGFYLAPAVIWLPVDTPTDHANTIDQDAYALLSLRAGWRPLNGHWSVLLDARNLTDRKYASSYLIRERVPDPAPPNAGPDQVTTFLPGNGRSFSLTLELSW